MFSRLLLLAGIATISSAAGAPVEIVPPELRGAVQPQVAGAPSGRVHVVFGKDNAIYHTSSADGRAFSMPVKIGELEKLALRMRRGPRVAASDRVVLVTAISHTDGNLHALISADTGGTWRESAPLNTVPKSAREGLHAIAGDGRGLVAAVWLDLRGRGTELRGRVSHDGGATWGDDVSIYQSPDGHICECCVPNVAIGPHGEIAAMWRNWLGGSRDFYLATSNDGGRTFTAAQKLGTGTWKLNGCPMDGGGLAFSPLGKPFAVWRREKTVFASESPGDEQPLSDASSQPVAAFGKAGAYVMWEHEGGLMLKRGPAPPVRFAENAFAPSIASMPGGRLVVVWESTATGPRSVLAETLE